MLNILLLLMLTIDPVTQSDRVLVASDSLYNLGIFELGTRAGWCFQPGDDLKRANPDFDDSDWVHYNPAGLNNPIPDCIAAWLRKLTCHVL